MTNTERAVDFLALVGAGHVHEAYAAHVADSFVHHNPYFAADRATLEAAMTDAAAAFPQQVVDVRRVVDAGDHVLTHSFVRPAPEHTGMVVMHLFRFEGDRIVELWDIREPAMADSPNALGPF